MRCAKASGTSARWRATWRTWREASQARSSHWASTAAANSRDSVDRKSTRLNSSHLVISYAVFCLKKKKKEINKNCHSDRLAPYDTNDPHDHQMYQHGDIDCRLY